MLCLSRKIEQEIRIGNDISVKVISLGGERVRLGIVAPADVKILRSELIPPPPAEDRPNTP